MDDGSWKAGGYRPLGATPLGYTALQLLEGAGCGGLGEPVGGGVPGARFYTTGLPALDAVLGGGWRGGHVTEVAGPAGVGKTLVRWGRRIPLLALYLAR